jgi:tetratricopeptide (TPR) repeat protein
MKAAVRSKEKLTRQARELLTYALHIQGARKETLDCIGQMPGDGRLPAQCLFIGQLLANYEKWDQAIECLMQIPSNALPQDRIGRTISNALLKAAIHFSEKQDWDQTLKCLAAAQTSFSENPLFAYLPEKLNKDLPIVFYQGGAYEKAIELWEDNLITEGYSPRRVHLLAIAFQAVAFNSSERPLSERIAHVVKAHMYWTALSTDTRYWQEIYNKRKAVYGPKITGKFFQSMVPGHGGHQCQMLMDQLQNGTDELKESERQQLLSDARQIMAVENHSAMLLSKICKEKNLSWPAGGLKMLSVYWEPERLNRELKKIDDKKPGSNGWLLKGLRNDADCQAYVHFLNDAYVKCIQATDNASGDDIRNLMGMALVARAETAIKGQQIIGCQELAEKLSGIPDKQIRKGAEALLAEMVSKRLKNYLQRRQRDEAIEFAGKILAHADLESVRETLSGAYLQRSEALYLEKGMEAFLEDYDQAVRYAKSLEVCQNHFAKIVRHRLNQLFNDKNFSEALSLLEKLKNR